MIQFRQHGSEEGTGLSYLAGEDLETDRPQDAARWVRIYSELVALHEDKPRGGRPGGDELLHQLRERLEEWRRRHLELAGLDFDPYARILTAGGRSLHLTRRESQLLDWLLDHPGQHFTSEALIQDAWEDVRLAPEQVRTYVVRLRRKLGEVQAPAQLVNRAHHGYALDVDPAALPRGRRRPSS